MNDELITALRDRAARGSDPGVAAVWDAAVAGAAPRRRRRRNRTRVLIAGVVSGLILMAFVVVVLRQVDSADVAIETEGQPPSTLPQGQEVTDPSGTVHLTLATGWMQTAVPAGTTPPAVLTIGTSPNAPPVVCDVAGGTDNPPSGTWLILYEYVGYENGAPLPLPAGGGNSGLPPLNAENLHDRPANFLDKDFFFNAERYCGLVSHSVDKVFRDNGRVFLARIETTDPIATRAFTKGREILNSLRVDSTLNDGSTPTTATETPPRADGIRPRELVRVVVMNATDVPGVAVLKSNSLRGLGYQVLPAIEDAQPQSGITLACRAGFDKEAERLAGFDFGPGDVRPEIVPYDEPAREGTEDADCVMTIGSVP